MSLPTNLVLDDDVVAVLRMPMAVKPLAKIVKRLVQVHGADLRMVQQYGWLVFRLPKDQP